MVGLTRVFFLPRRGAYTSSNPYTMERRVFVGTRRAAGTGREDPQHHTNPSQPWFDVNVYLSNCEGKQGARKPPLGGYGG